MWVVGTKYDMIDNDEVSLVKREEIEEFAKEFNLHISYTSSKDNIGITVKYNTNNTINLIKIINLINQELFRDIGEKTIKSIFQDENIKNLNKIQIESKINRKNKSGSFKLSKTSLDVSGLDIMRKDSKKCC